MKHRLYAVNFKLRGEELSIPLDLVPDEKIPYDLTEMYAMAKTTLIEEGYIKEDLSELDDVLVVSHLVTEAERQTVKDQQ